MGAGKLRDTRRLMIKNTDSDAWALVQGLSRQAPPLGNAVSKASGRVREARNRRYGTLSSSESLDGRINRQGTWL